MNTTNLTINKIDLTQQALQLLYSDQKSKNGNSEDDVINQILEVNNWLDGQKRIILSKKRTYKKGIRILTEAELKDAVDNHKPVAYSYTYKVNMYNKKAMALAPLFKNSTRTMTAISFPSLYYVGSLAPPVVRFAYSIDYILKNDDTANAVERKANGEVLEIFEAVMR